MKTMSKKQKNTVTVNDVEYDVDKMEFTEQYLVMQIRDVRDQINRLNLRLGQLQASQSTFMKTLAEALKKEAA
jgi:TolA-binding protein